MLFNLRMFDDCLKPFLLSSCFSPWTRLSWTQQASPAVCNNSPRYLISKISVFLIFHRKRTADTARLDSGKNSNSYSKWSSSICILAKRASGLKIKPRTDTRTFCHVWSWITQIHSSDCSVVDHTRVILKDMGSEPGADYINANYIDVCEKSVFPVWWWKQFRGRRQIASRPISALRVV